jgi:hypothetical protein
MYSISRAQQCGLAAGAALLLALSGCAGTPLPAVTVTVSPTAEPSPSETPTPTPEAIEEVPMADAPELVPNAPAAPFVPLPEGPAEDLGAGPGARGAPTRNDAGNLSGYVVIEGDTFFDIAQRFNVPVQQLLKMNPKVAGLGEAIYLKQNINLDWTITG